MIGYPATAFLGSISAGDWCDIAVKGTALDFLTSRGVGIGLSLDGHIAAVANKTGHNWSGGGSYDSSLAAIERLKGYPGYNVI